MKLPPPPLLPEIQRIVEAIVAAVNPRRLILFGSRARGCARPDSDVDLLVIEDEPFGPGRSRLSEVGRLYRACSGSSLPKDILVYSQHEVDRWRCSLNHVIAKALREGLIVYERS